MHLLRALAHHALGKDEEADLELSLISSMRSNAMDHAIFACCLPPLKCAKPLSQGLEVIMLQVRDHLQFKA